MSQILVAPDSFGDTLTATAAATAIVEGWRRVRPNDVLVLSPQSDGGPGFVDVLAAQLPSAHRYAVWVRGPLDDDVNAEWLLDGTTAYIECAQACGLPLLRRAPSADTAWRAHSKGVGQLIAAALDGGATRIVVGLGGSSCTDGGAGLIEGLGGIGEARRLLATTELVVASDVEHPLLGARGAAAVFGPQKGADQETVERLEARLTGWVAEMEAGTGRSVRDLAGAGAAGGIGAALLALGGRRESGARIVAVHTGLDAAIARAQLVITGEGKFDDQTLHGKVAGAVASRAATSGIQVLVLAGQVALTAAEYGQAGIARAESIAQFAGSVQLAMEDAAGQLAGLAAQVARDWSHG
ncbi:Glycerate 2-kinase [Mycobacteroides salmoniphilum]|uniref:Glycerate 2-kinase n=1 Tax=Mycobacteroides salmoniphilum TaxID=404941 RepID=A0A4R8S154_9MYCO|nr:glycerate kinase [Mycobacteroides salmoniphilum]TDZ79745.1 Glycerate 2-kinase [Mycobacteroides salmoniphilum]